MDAMVLAYNFEGAELKKLKKLCAGKGARLRAVAPGDWAQPVGALCGVEKRVGEAPGFEPPGEKMLVLAHFAGRQLESLLTELRTSRVAVDALKAVLTPTNAKWDARTLAAELTRERSAMKKA